VARKKAEDTKNKRGEEGKEEGESKKKEF